MTMGEMSGPVLMVYVWPLAIVTCAPMLACLAGHLAGDCRHQVPRIASKVIFSCRKTTMCLIGETPWPGMPEDAAVAREPSPLAKTTPVMAATTTNSKSVAGRRVARVDRDTAARRPQKGGHFGGSENAVLGRDSSRVTAVC